MKSPEDCQLVTDMQWLRGQLRKVYSNDRVYLDDRLANVIIVNGIRLTIPYSKILSEVGQRIHMHEIETIMDRRFTMFLYACRMVENDTDCDKKYRLNNITEFQHGGST